MKLNIAQNRHKKKSLVALFALSFALLFTARLLATPQDTRNRAASTARLYFTPISTQASPLQRKVNSQFTTKLMLDPGQSKASFVRFEIIYDPTKLSINTQNGIVINSTAFPVVFEGPLFSPGKIEASISIGNDPLKALTSITEVASITFTATTKTTAPITVRPGDNSQILSIAQGDSATDNVLGIKEPLVLIIGDENSGVITPTAILTPSTIPTITTYLSPSARPSVTAKLTPSTIPGNVTGCTLELSLTQNVYDMAVVGSHIWITTTSGILRLQADGKQIDTIITGNGLDSPSGLAVVDSQVWVLNRFNKKIIRFNPDGKAVTDGIVNLTGSQYPVNVRLTGIAVVGQEVWITDEDNGKIYRLDKSGESVTTPITRQYDELNAPQALTVVGNEVWVSNSNFHNKINSIPDIVRFSTVGTYIDNSSRTGRTEDELPLDILTYNNEGWLMVGNVDARILRLNSEAGQEDLLTTIKNIAARKFVILNNKMYVLAHEGTNNSIRILNLDGTSNPCPTPNPSTLVPTGTPRTTFVLNMRFHGIGSAGDSLNPKDSELSNQHPIHQEKTLDVQIVNEENQIVASKIATAFYNSTTGQYFSNIVVYDPLPEGDYVVKVKTDPYLRKIMPGFLTVKPNAKNNMEVTDLINGDVNGDNNINILDYNILLDCGYGAVQPLPMVSSKSLFRKKACQAHEEKDYADLNDDGTISSTDYNLFIRELTVGLGQ